MLAKVIKPDHTAVTFKYDALDRRVEKQSNEKITTFIWDGNTIFHEYFSVGDSEKSENVSENSPQSNAERPANLITWVFNDGLVPSAKLTSEGNYSIISDYLGTPVEAYDEQGKKVWSAELDIYGRVQEFTGEQDFIPFRYQGQYEDVEIGLYYNRFRYYDPAQGNYTQVDPIGLAGGNPTLYGFVDDPNTWIDPLGLKSIIFTATNGMSLQVGGYTNLGHLSNKDLEKLYHANNNALNGKGFGLSAKDAKGNTIVLHHHKQNPQGPIQAMPAKHHSIGNRGQHPNGNTKGGGLTSEERIDFNIWKQEFWRNRAEQELKSRNVKVVCRG